MPRKTSAPLLRLAVIGSAVLLAGGGGAAPASAAHRARHSHSHRAARRLTAHAAKLTASGVTTYVVTPVADATVSSSTPSANYGTSTALTELGGSTINRAYLRFVVPTLNGPVASASLQLYPTSSADFSLRTVANTAWTESGLTWAAAPTYGGVVANSGSVPAGAYVPLNLGSVVAGSGPVGFVLTTGDARTMTVASRETLTPPKLVVTTNTSPAITSYVSTSGSDANPGTHAAPWRTVGHAASVAAAGSTVNILAGSYGEDVTLATSGSAGSPITFAFAGTGSATIRSLNIAASHIVVSGVGVSGAVNHCVTVQPALTDVTLEGGRIGNCGGDGVHFVRGASQPYTSAVTIANNSIFAVGRSDQKANDMTIYANNITVRGNDLTGSPNDAINMWGDHHTYSQNTIHDLSNSYGNHNDAFQTWTGLNDGTEGNPVTNLLIERNVIHNVLGSDAHVLMSEGPGHHDWTIRNNLVWNIGDQSFVFGKDGNGSRGIVDVLLYNNTFVSAGANNTIEFNLTTSGKLVNNIFYNCVGWGGSVPYYLEATATVLTDYNLAGGSTAGLSEPHGQNGDPAFVSPQGNFQLLSGSRAINAGDHGTIVSPGGALDLYGNSSQGADIGAAQYHA